MGEALGKLGDILSGNWSLHQCECRKLHGLCVCVCVCVCVCWVCVGAGEMEAPSLRIVRDNNGELD
jgi:hypothetical protein